MRIKFPDANRNYVEGAGQGASKAGDLLDTDPGFGRDLFLRSGPMTATAAPAIVPVQPTVDIRAFDTAAVTIGTDTTFIFTTLDGWAVTMIGRGFRFGPSRRLIAGTVRAFFISDSTTLAPIAEHDGLAIEVVQ